MTAVIQLLNYGALQAFQIGLVDIVTTVTAAHSAWGWVGGLQGISAILSLSRNDIERKKLGKIFKSIEPDPASCRILVQHGMEELLLGEGEAFGDGIGSKLVGMTLCALGHNMKPQSALNLFMEFFVNSLFQNTLSANPGFKEALNTLLLDKHQIILNEGAIRHLPELFNKAITALNITSGLKASSHPRNRSYVGSDVGLIHGFLKWLTRGTIEPYYTRSAAVARLAACLRSVGYNISQVLVWKGLGERPLMQRSITLVTGGASQTDDMFEDETNTWSIDLIAHYRWNTVGGMLWNSFVQECAESHYETFQEDFDNIDHIMEACLSFQWAYVDTKLEEIQAFPVWTGESPHRPSRIATRSAAIFFPSSIDTVAIYYERIAKEEYLDAMKPRQRSPNAPQPTKEIQRFQALTASICLSVLARLGGPMFKRILHSTMLDLSSMDHLKWLCREIDAIVCGGCGMSRVISVLAAMHCAMEFPVNESVTEGLFYSSQDDSQKDSQIIGWRNGRYAVLPNLLFSMEDLLQRTVLDLRCVDQFIGNLTAQRNGSIHSPDGLPGSLGFTSELFQESTTVEEIEQTRLGRVGFGRISAEAPISRTANHPLYLSLERPYSGSGDPQISLCGRLDGESIGCVGIQDVLKTLALSWNDEEGFPFNFCFDGNVIAHEPFQGIGAEIVYNMPASQYCSRVSFIHRDGTTSTPRHNVYVQVAEDTPWTIFLAGQSSIHNRVAFGCADCAVRAGSHHTARTSGGLRTIIGYQ